MAQGLPDSSRNSLPHVFAPRELARSGGCLAGTVQARVLPRIAPELRADASLEVTIKGARAEGGGLQLRIRVRGAVILTCQRCLDAVRVVLDAASDLRILASEKEAEALPDQVEPLLVDTEVGLTETLGLVEEEVILALPIVARHDPGACAPQRPMRDSGEADHPFAALRRLKSGRSGA